MMEQNASIIKPVKDEILNPTVDLAIDYAEIGLDTLLDNNAISEIPFIKTVVGIVKVGLSIKEKYDLKKLLIFFKEFHDNTISEEKLNSFKYKFNTDEKYRNKVVEAIVLWNERYLDIRKSKILANLIKEHVEGSLTWDELNDLSSVLDKIHTRGFQFLKKMSEQNWAYHRGEDKDNEALMFSCGVGHRYGTEFSISKMGQDLYNYGIKPVL